MWNKLAELATENLDKGMQIQVHSQSPVQSLYPEAIYSRARNNYRFPQRGGPGRPTGLACVHIPEMDMCQV